MRAQGALFPSSMGINVGGEHPKLTTKTWVKFSPKEGTEMRSSRGMNLVAEIRSYCRALLRALQRFPYSHEKITQPFHI